MMDFFSFIGYIVMLLICIAVIIAIGYGVLFFIGAIVGGVLTLIDKFKP